MTARPTSYPKTTRVLSGASLIAAFVEQYWKGQYHRPRPSQLCPALLPPIVVPGHAAYPSGHSTQSHLMAYCMGLVFAGLPSAEQTQMQGMETDLVALADRIARNREIAGLHYPSDTAGGVTLAGLIRDQLRGLPNTSLWQKTIAAATVEWTW